MIAPERSLGAATAVKCPCFAVLVPDSQLFPVQKGRWQRMPGKRAHGRGVRLIAAFKLLKALGLLALGVGALKLLHKDVAGEVEHWINVFRVDPHNHFIDLLLEKLSILDDRRLKELSVGTFVYSGIFFVEGIGLALQKRWAEYLTIVTTASLLPLEIYELTRRVTAGRCLALVVNLAIVGYLIYELRRFQGQKKADS